MVNMALEKEMREMETGGSLCSIVTCAVESRGSSPSPGSIVYVTSGSTAGMYPGLRPRNAAKSATQDVACSEHCLTRRACTRKRNAVFAHLPLFHAANTLLFASITPSFL